jgi:hypothetical protein
VGRVLGTSSGRKKASAHSAVITGDLGRKLHCHQPDVAMAKTLARLGDARQVTYIQVLTHRCQHLERKTQQGGLLGKDMLREPAPRGHRARASFT